jgi:Ala-tRNA(Pro) deacylase
MPLNERARVLLDSAHVRYQTLPHREAFTAQGVAAASHVSGWQLAKVVVVTAGDGPLMAVLPASCRLDLGKLSRVSGQGDLALLPEADMERLFPDCEPGAMPPFGGPYGVPVFVDACLATADEVVFQAGNHHEVVRMSYPDYERLSSARVADICTR